VQLLITVGDAAKLTARNALKNSRGELQTKSFRTTAELCENLGELIDQDDIILIKASRINKFEKVISRLRQLFDVRTT